MLNINQDEISSRKYLKQMNESTPLLINPYANTRPADLHRTTITFPTKERVFLGSLTQGRSSLQDTIAILIERTINEFKRNGITEYDPIRYNIAIAGLTVNLGGCSPVNDRSSTPVVQQVPVGNDGRGDGLVACEHPENPPQPSNPRRAPRRNRRKGTASGGGETSEA